jgi:hypothetical protein
MSKAELTIRIDCQLVDTLRECATERELTERAFVKEIVESAIASYRLQQMPAALNHPRMPGELETMMRGRGEVECRAAEPRRNWPLSPGDVPTMDDVAVLEDVIR